MTTSVANLHPQYTDMIDIWTTMTDVCSSESQMHDKGTRYIPKLDKMSDAQYSAYVKRAEFPLFTKHALDAFVGMSMRKNLLISGIDVNHPFFKNCDGRGSTLKKYAEGLVRKFLQYGRCGTLIDFPITDPNKSKAAAEAENIGPKLSFYDHLSIINWKTKFINKVEVLTLVVLKETVYKNEDDIFGHDTEDQYRVLRLINNKYVQEIYDEGGALKNSIIPLMNNKEMDFIPFIIHGGPVIITPVMMPIAEQNIHWYMKSADYCHGLHYVALPTPWVEGVEGEKKEDRPSTIGPQEIWYLPTGSSCGMLEFTGAGLGEIDKSMTKTMSNITVLSSQILVPKNAYDETATAASIRNATETASLSSVVSFLSLELTIAVTIASKWGNFYVEGTKVEINSDFIPLTLSGADVSAYVSSVIKQGFSQRTLFDLLKKGEVIEGDRQFADEIADIKREAKERMDQEIEQAKRLAEVQAAATIVQDNKIDATTQNKDSKETTVQKDANKASTNSSQQKSKDDN